MTFQDKIRAICSEIGLPKIIVDDFMPFSACYAQAAKDPSVDTFKTYLQAVGRQLKSSHPFGAYHKAVRDPVDYYKMGLDFVRPLIDFTHSKVLGTDALKSIDEALKRKENVILLANHQTEIDPQIISLLLEKEYPEIARDMIFVAGHRVVTDPLAVPFSMGRNLICIFSKRHMDEPPEKKGEKLAHNQKALAQFEELLNEGGHIFFLAPSGGRDRKSAEGAIEIAPFDPQSVEMFYLLSQKAKRPTHIHSLALETYDLLPPPKEVSTEIGEKRSTCFSPAKLAFSPKIDMEHIGGSQSISDKKERRQKRAAAIWQQVVDNYKEF